VAGGRVKGIDLLQGNRARHNHSFCELSAFIVSVFFQFFNRGMMTLGTGKE
jgi:hypothetical protein